MKAPGSLARVVLAVGLVVAAFPGVASASRAAPAPASPGSSFGILTGVSCPSPQHCVATGEIDDASGGRIIGTSDGGSTWRRLGTPPGAGALSAVACVSTSRCEVDGSGNGDAGAVYGTHDGGRTWRVQPAVIGGGLFFGMACASYPDCEATGNMGEIFGTTDGGRRWIRQAVPGPADLVESVACPAATTCEAVGYGGDGLALRSTDGGATWQHQALPPAVQFLSGVVCATVHLCVAVGQNTVDSGSREVGVIVVTHDGGRSWWRRLVPPGVTDVTSVSCPSPQVCEAVGLGSFSILGTIDGGRTWTGQAAPGSPYLLGVSCPRVSTCEAVGQDSNSDIAAFGTRDGGRTWTRQPVPA